MSSDHTYNRFFELIRQSSVGETVLCFFDEEDRKIRIKKIEEQLDSMSSGEQIMIRFFAAVWFHDNRLNFDPIDAAASLDSGNREIVAGWIAAPFWP